MEKQFAEAREGIRLVIENVEQVLRSTIPREVANYDADHPPPPGSKFYFVKGPKGRSPSRHREKRSKTKKRASSKPPSQPKVAKESLSTSYKESRYLTTLDGKKGSQVIKEEKRDKEIINGRKIRDESKQARSEYRFDGSPDSQEIAARKSSSTISRPAKQTSKARHICVLKPEPSEEKLARKSSRSENDVDPEKNKANKKKKQSSDSSRNKKPEKNTSPKRSSHPKVAKESLSTSYKESRYLTTLDGKKGSQVIKEEKRDKEIINGRKIRDESKQARSEYRFDGSPDSRVIPSKKSSSTINLPAKQTSKSESSEEKLSRKSSRSENSVDPVKNKAAKKKKQNLDVPKKPAQKSESKCSDDETQNDVTRDDDDNESESSGKGKVKTDVTQPSTEINAQEKLEAAKKRREKKSKAKMVSTDPTQQSPPSYNTMSESRRFIDYVNSRLEELSNQQCSDCEKKKNTPVEVEPEIKKKTKRPCKKRKRSKQKKSSTDLKSTSKGENPTQEDQSVAGTQESPKKEKSADYGVIITGVVALTRVDQPSEPPKNIDFQIDCPGLEPRRVCLNGVWKNL